MADFLDALLTGLQGGRQERLAKMQIAAREREHEKTLQFEKEHAKQQHEQFMATMEENRRQREQASNIHRQQLALEAGKLFSTGGFRDVTSPLPQTPAIPSMAPGMPSTPALSPTMGAAKTAGMPIDFGPGIGMKNIIPHEERVASDIKQKLAAEAAAQQQGLEITSRFKKGEEKEYAEFFAPGDKDKQNEIIALHHFDPNFSFTPEHTIGLKMFREFKNGGLDKKTAQDGLDASLALIRRLEMAKRPEAASTIAYHNMMTQQVGASMAGRTLGAHAIAAIENDPNMSKLPIDQKRQEAIRFASKIGGSGPSAGFAIDHINQEYQMRQVDPLKAKIAGMIPEAGQTQAKPNAQARPVPPKAPQTTTQFQAPKTPNYSSPWEQKQLEGVRQDMLRQQQQSEFIKSLLNQGRRPNPFIDVLTNK